MHTPSSFIQSCGLATMAGLSLTLVMSATPANQANVAHAQASDLDMLQMDYDLAYDDLTRTGFICQNNPSEDCGGSPYEVSEDHKIPSPDYDVEDLTNFDCVNNVKAVCENPRHYGVLYTEAMEPERVTTRTDAVFAQIGESSPAEVTLPPRTSVAPAPNPVPIQGLW